MGAVPFSGHTRTSHPALDDRARAQVVELLLESGAEVDAADKEAETALHAAAKKGTLGTVKQLLKAKARATVARLIP